MINFKNKKVLITGASGGIGSSLIKKFVELEAEVLGTGTNAEKLDQIKKKHPNIKVKKFDISEHSRIEEFIENVSLELNGLDILCNVAGVIRRGKIDTISDETELEVWLSSKKIGLDSPVSTFNKNKITGRLNPINGIPKSLNSGIKVEALNWAISVSESSKLSIE